MCFSPLKENPWSYINLLPNSSSSRWDTQIIQLKLFAGKTCSFRGLIQSCNQHVLKYGHVQGTQERRSWIEPCAWWMSEEKEGGVENFKTPSCGQLIPYHSQKKKISAHALWSLLDAVFPRDFWSIPILNLKTTANKVDEKWSRFEAGPGLQNVAFSSRNLAHLAKLMVLFLVHLGSFKCQWFVHVWVADLSTCRESLDLICHQLRDVYCLPSIWLLVSHSLIDRNAL